MSQPRHAGPRRRGRTRFMGLVAAFSAIAVLAMPMAAAYAAEGDVADPAIVSDVVLPQDDSSAPADVPAAPEVTPTPEAASTPTPEPEPAPAPEQVTEPEAPAPLARSMTVQTRPDPKVWVCKVVRNQNAYVLKSGKQPIQVSANALGPDVNPVPGAPFSDAQPSFVVASDDRALCEAGLPPVQYMTVLWKVVDSNGNGDDWEQVYVDSEITSAPNLNALDALMVNTECTRYQADVYRYTLAADKANVDALIAGGVLNNPSDPFPEPLIPGGAGTAWKTVGTNGTCEVYDPHMVLGEMVCTADGGAASFVWNSGESTVDIPMKALVNGQEVYSWISAPGDGDETVPLPFGVDGQYSAELWAEVDGEWVLLDSETFDVNCAPEIPQCEAFGSYTLDAGDFVYSDTRATGHYKFTDDGLKVWTEGATSTDKVAEYWVIDKPLSDIGQPTIDHTADFGIPPGLNLFVDFDGNGTVDGILVGESVYGDNWWLSNSAAAFVKAGAPNTGGGNGSNWFGTLSEWRAAFPDNNVELGGFSLGSGVYASGVIHSVTMGCVVYTFQAPPKPVVCEEIVDGGVVTNLDMDGWVVTNGTWTEDGLRLDSDNWVDATVTKPTSFNLAAARDLALDMDVSAAGNYGLGIVLHTSAGDLHWEDIYTDEFWSNEAVLPPTGGGQGGPYSGSLEDALETIGDVTVTSVTIVFSSATPNSAMLNSATFNCTVVAFDYERPPAPPTKDPTFTEWSDGDWDCGDTTVEQTRTRTDYAAPVWDTETMTWVEDKVGTTTTETQPRDLTDEERKEWQTADPEGECYNRPEPPDPDEDSQTTYDCKYATTHTRVTTWVWNETDKQYDKVVTESSSQRPVTAEEIKANNLVCTPPPPPPTCPSGTTWVDANHDGKVTTNECKNTPPAADTDWSNHESLTSPTWMSTWLAAGIALLVFAGLGASSLVRRLWGRGIQ